MSRLASLAIAVLLAAALWWYRGIAHAYDMFGGSLGFALDVAASTLTSMIAVVVIGEIVIGFGLVMLLGMQATGLQRTLVYAALTVAATATVLEHFGVNITAVLATSVALTAIIGLALQTTLGAFIAGLTLQADRVLRIGDAIVQNNETAIVTSIGWRSVLCRKEDGTRVVISNSKILDGSVDLLLRGRPIRGEVIALLPLAAPPRRIADLARSVLIGTGLVDTSRSISAVATAFDPEKATTRYRIRFWVLSFDDRDTVADQLLEGLWYAIQREDLVWPVSANCLTNYQRAAPSLSAAEWAGPLSRALQSLVSQQATGREIPTVAEAAEAGWLLLFADGERIAMPDRVAGCSCVLLQGRLQYVASAPSDPSRGEAGDPSRRNALTHMTSDLAESIGPYAQFAVQDAASADADLGTIGATLAREIDDSAKRAHFMARHGAAAANYLEAGAVLDLRRDANGLLRPRPPMRADGAVAIAAIPDELLKPAPSPRDGITST